MNDSQTNSNYPKLSKLFANSINNNPLVPILYHELKQLAHRKLNNQRDIYAIDTTELVHETYIKLTIHDKKINDRGHFFSLAAQAMRHILVDVSRKIYAQKRGDGKKDITFDEDIFYNKTSQWLEIDEALTKLSQVNTRLVKVVECRFFAGLNEKETAQALAVNVRTVQRDWLRARLWLQKFLLEPAA